MKVTATISVICCGVVFVGALGLLALTSYHLWNDNDSGNVPMEQSDEWITHVISLIPICVIFMLLCVFSLWTILMNDKMKCFIAVLILNFLCLAATVYFAVVFANELDAAPASGELLFNRTKEAISKTAKPAWLPSWLDSIQHQSPECCGILTFRDWEEFWPSLESQVPRSCCKDPENTTTYCPVDISRLPYPGTPSMFIKTDTGCLDEINDLMKKNIRECFIYIILMCCVIGCSEIAYFIQFYKQYVPKAGARDRYTSSGDKFFDEKGGPQGDDGLDVPNTTDTDSYLQLSGFTASLQTTSSGSFQSAGIDPDTGDRTTLGFPATMDSYDPIALGTTASSSGFGGRQRSMARMDDQPQFRRPGFNGPLGSSNTNLGYGNQNTNVGGYGNSNTNLDSFDDSQNQAGLSSLTVASSSSELDQFGQKKKKKHRHRNDIGTESNPKDSRLQRQEVFIAPDTIEDFAPAASTAADPNFPASGSQSSLNEVGDQLADNTQPQTNKDKDKKKFGLGMNRKRR